MTRFGSIYKITNLVNGKVYIGQTTTPLEMRWSSHRSAAKTEFSKSVLHKALVKYGPDNFLVEEIAVCTDRSSLDSTEIVCINQFNSKVPNGYNLCSGGLGFNHHETTKEKIRAYRHTDDTRRKMSETQTKRYQDPSERKKQSRVQSEEERKKRSETMKRLGHKPSQAPEAIAKMAAAKRGKPSGKAKPIIDQHGTIYISMTDAADKTGNNVAAVSLVISGKRKQAKGYIFTYVKKENN